MGENFSTASTEIVTVTFFRYARMEKIWGMSQMQLAQRPLRKTDGLKFFKLLGSGAGNGFSLRPDFSVYSVLSVWSDQQKAENFFSGSPVFRRFQKHSAENWTVSMRAVKSHGRWAGTEPFAVSGENPNGSVLAVLTRATLRLKHTARFWQFVPNASADFPDQKGLIFAKGIGELPVIQQATFSLWRSRADMTAYAYRDKRHTEVIKKTRELGWYKEELFAEFEPFASAGTWNGANPLADYLT